jgi:hypothetical protein
MMQVLLPLPAPRHVGRSVHPDDIAQRLERARILLSGCCEALIEVEHAVPEAGPLVDALDRLLERARDLVGAYDPPELPLAS